VEKFWKILKTMDKYFARFLKGKFFSITLFSREIPPHGMMKAQNRYLRLCQKILWVKAILRKEKNSLRENSCWKNSDGENSVLIVKKRPEKYCPKIRDRIFITGIFPAEGLPSSIFECNF
jgi:hypothetical protein